MGKDNIQVCLRVRPLLGHEKGCKNIITYPHPNQVTIATKQGAKNMNFTYDYVFPAEISQEDMYMKCVSPSVKSFLGGYNTTIIAYGQTGSGKTYTMGTAAGNQHDRQAAGIVPRVAYEIFDHMSKSSNTCDVKVSFLEVYNETIVDLLNPQARSDIKVQRSMSGDIVVVGLSEEPIQSADQLLTALDRGSGQRVVASTNMNAVSSRSHAIFTVYLTQKKVGDIDGEEDDVDGSSDSVLTSKFNFVDLAGSERLKRTGAEGSRMREGISINQGLLVLGNCISALGDPKRRGAHVPFRDSKITRLLQDSLGGNSKTMMIACCSPASSNFDETLNSLRYANRAKNIKNKAVVNADPNMIKIKQMRSRIKQLEAALALAGGTIPPNALSSGTVSISNDELELLKDQSKLYANECKRLQRKMKEVRILMGEAVEESRTEKRRSNELQFKLESVLKEYAEKVGGTPQSVDDIQLSEEDTLKIDELEASRMETETRNDEVKTLKKEIERQKKIVIKYQEHFGCLPMSHQRGMTFNISKKNHSAELKTSLDGDVQDNESVSTATEQEDGSLSGYLSDDNDDEDVESLEIMASLKSREHAIKMKQLSKVQRSLDTDLVAQERLLTKLTQAKREADSERRTYESKLRNVEKEISGIKRERDKILKETNKNDANYQKVVDRYKKKLEIMKSKIDEYKHKLRENEQLKKIHAKEERQIQKLTLQVQKSKRQKVLMARKISDKEKSYQNWKKDKEKKMKKMRKQARLKQLEMQKLKKKIDAQNAKLRREAQRNALLKARNKMQNDKLKRAQAMQKKKKQRAAAKSRIARGRPKSMKKGNFLRVDRSPQRKRRTLDVNDSDDDEVTGEMLLKMFKEQMSVLTNEVVIDVPEKSLREELKQEVKSNSSAGVDICPNCQQPKNSKTQNESLQHPNDKIPQGKKEDSEKPSQPWIKPQVVSRSQQYGQQPPLQYIISKRPDETNKIYRSRSVDWMP